MNNFYPRSRCSGLVVQELNEETLIYDLQIDKVFRLNQTAALVYQLSDGNRSTAEISREMSRKLELPVAEELVWLAIERLEKDDLLANSILHNLPRRELIKRAGLFSLAALPVITSLVAPAAVMAQSCTQLQGSCSSSSQCCSGLRCAPYDPICCVGNGARTSGTLITLDGITYSSCSSCQSILNGNCCSGGSNNFSCSPYAGRFICSGTCT